jgi:hypothetical protein
MESFAILCCNLTSDVCGLSMLSDAALARAVADLKTAESQAEEARAAAAKTYEANLAQANQDRVAALEAAVASGKQADSAELARVKADLATQTQANKALQTQIDALNSTIVELKRANELRVANSMSLEDVNLLQEKHSEVVRTLNDKLASASDADGDSSARQQELEESVRRLENEVEVRKSSSAEVLEQRLNIALVQLDKFREIVKSLQAKNSSVTRSNAATDPAKLEEVKLQLQKERAAHAKANSTIETLQSQVQALLGTPPMPPSKNTVHRAERIYTSRPIIMVEIGSFTSRVGSWNADSRSFELR